MKKTEPSYCQGPGTSHMTEGCTFTLSGPCDLHAIICQLFFTTFILTKYRYVCMHMCVYMCMKISIRLCPLLSLCHYMYVHVYMYVSANLGVAV